MPAIEVEHLYKIFGRKPQEAVKRMREGATAQDVRNAGATAAVIDASFTVDEGEIFVVMGLSGSGKSTLIRMVNRLLDPTAGQVCVYDEDITTMSAAELREVRRKRVSMVFQHFALFPHRTVAENAAYGLEPQGVGKAQRRERALEALRLTGLEGGRTTCRASCPAGCSSAWAWPGRWPPGPRSC